MTSYSYLRRSLAFMLIFSGLWISDRANDPFRVLKKFSSVNQLLKVIHIGLRWSEGDTDVGFSREGKVRLIKFPSRGFADWGLYFKNWVTFICLLCQSSSLSFYISFNFFLFYIFSWSSFLFRIWTYFCF